MSIKSERVKKWRRSMKEKLIEAMGAKCIICGYNRCSASLHLHHLNPDEKDFAISQITANPKNIKTIINEAKKCVLLCANCHGEVHTGMTTIPEYPIFDESVFEKPPKMEYKCKTCGKLTYNKSHCSARCSARYRVKINWPEPHIVLDMVQKTNFTQTGDTLGVSDVAVRKYLRKHNLIP